MTLRCRTHGRQSIATVLSAVERWRETFTVVLACGCNLERPAALVKARIGEALGWR